MDNCLAGGPSDLEIDQFPSGAPTDACTALAMLQLQPASMHASEDEFATCKHRTDSVHSSHQET
jgi:hypothetical protein